MAGSDPRPAILLVGGDGHPSGVPRHICTLSAALSDIAQVHVASEADQGGYTALQEAGVPHHVTPGLRSALSPARLRQGWRGLLGCLRARDWDIVWLHARLPVLMGRLALALGVWRPGPRTRIVVTYHGLPFGPGHRPGFSTLSLLAERRFLAACPALDLVFLSPRQAARMRAVMGSRRMARHRIHVLPNGSDLGEIPAPGPRPAGRHLIMTGRSGYQKNYPLAVQLFAHLPDDCHLTLCGAGTERPDLQKRLRRIAGAAADRLHFKGPLNDVREVLAMADAYLLTSRYEGLPIGALEAFEAGLPLVLSRFETARALVAVHPLALDLRLAPDSLAADAAAVADLLDRFAADRASYVARTRAAWKQHWSGDAFSRQAQALVRGLLGQEDTVVRAESRRGSDPQG